MKWWPAAPKAGDVIRVKVGSVYHYGIFASEDDVIAFGPRPTREAMVDISSFKVISSNIYEFCGDTILEVAVPETSEEKRRFPPKKAIKLARARIGEGGYDIIHNNCEHFVNECVYGKKYSAQVEELRRRFYENKSKNN